MTPSMTDDFAQNDDSVPDSLSDERSATERAADLTTEAQVQNDAIWSSPSARRSHRSALLGYITGEVGPKGDVSANLRELSRSQRTRLGADVPHGTTTPGTGRYILAAVAALIALLSGFVAVIAWLLW